MGEQTNGLSNVPRGALVAWCIVIGAAVVWLLPLSRDNVAEDNPPKESTEQLTIDTLIDNGYSAMETGNRDEAAHNNAYGFFSRAKNLSRYSLHGRFGVAWARHARGDPAADWYKLYEETAKDATLLVAFSLVNMARSKLKEGKHKEAISLFTRAAHVEYDKAIGWIRLGETLQEMDRHKAAIPPLYRATQLEPSNANAWFTYGAALGHSGSVPAARKSLNKAAALNPQLQNKITALYDDWAAPAAK